MRSTASADGLAQVNDPMEAVSRPPVRDFDPDCFPVPEVEDLNFRAHGQEPARRRQLAAVEALAIGHFLALSLSTIIRSRSHIVGRFLADVQITPFEVLRRRHNLC